MAISNENSNTPELEKDLAQTPWFVIKGVEHLFNTKILLDVCASSKTAKCKNYLTKEIDALSTNHWSKSNWCNPPFSNIMPWIERAVAEALIHGNTTYMLLPNNPETGYIRTAKMYAEYFIEMPFRLKFLRPDGTEFLGKNGKPQSPKFSSAIAVFSTIGLKAECKSLYYDFRLHKGD